MGVAKELQRQGAFDKAEAEIRAVIAARQEVFGPDHVQVDRVRADLARVLHQTGRSELAEVEQRAALRMLEAHHGQDAPRLATEDESLGVILIKQGRRSEGVPLVTVGVAGMERYVAQTRPMLAQMRANLAQQLVLDGRRDEARVLAEKACDAVKDSGRLARGAYGRGRRCGRGGCVAAATAACSGWPKMVLISASWGALVTRE